MDIELGQIQENNEEVGQCLFLGSMESLDSKCPILKKMGLSQEIKNLGPEIGSNFRK